MHFLIYSVARKVQNLESIVWYQKNKLQASSQAGEQNAKLYYFAIVYVVQKILSVLIVQPSARCK